MSPTEKKHAAIHVVKNEAAEQGFDFFHDEQRRAFATVPVAEHQETWEVRSRDFKLWVKQTLFDRVGVAPDSWVKTTVEEFETQAICKGRCESVFLRIAPKNGKLYLDLCNARWQVVEITNLDWGILDSSPVKFRRAAGMTALPLPHADGDVRELITFLNLRSTSDEILLLTWLTYCLQVGSPYPIISLSGVQGAGKSTTARVLRSLIDPSVAPLTTIPKGERDLAIAANNSHVIVLDNLSDISAPLSDALCRVATGGSFRTRKLYTDNEEMLFTFQRPVILNGIEELPLRSDLLDRTILIHLEPIPAERRCDEAGFWRRFADAQPRILGALLDIVRTGRTFVDRVEIPALPRMADFGRWGVAVETALGFKPGDFLAAYRANIEHGISIALEASPVAWTLHEYLSLRKEFAGSSSELLKALVEFTTDASGKPTVARRDPAFPKSATRLSAEIDRVQPNLAKLGITVERWRTNRKRFIRLVLSDMVTPSDTHTSSASPSNLQQTEGMPAGVTQ